MADTTIGGTRTSPRFRLWLGVGGVAALLLWVFWEPIFSGQSLYSPDNAPFYGQGHRAFVASSFTGRWSPLILGIAQGAVPFHPSRLLEVSLPPLVYHTANYILDVLLAYLAGLFLLRGRGLPPVSCHAGGIALAFAGYAFTLISAGHRGIFDMMPYVLLALGCLDRAIARGSWFHFALAGAGFGFALSSQLDITLLLGMLAVAYAAHRAWRTWPAAGGARFVLRLATGAAIAAIFFVATSAALFGGLLQAFAGARAQQLALGTDGAEPPSAEKQWIFATNWSLPPEEVLEFVAPGIYGLETGHPEGPYWGRLGRTHRWEEHRQGLMNLRQHTVYLGVLQLLFAAYALTWAVRRQRAAQPPAAGTPDSASDLLLAEWRWDVRFWSGVWIVALLLAFGRYFPLYRLFYAIPKMSQMRCPVKFLHHVEIATALLFAYGLALFVGEAARRAARPAAGGKDAPAPRPAMALGFAIAAGLAALALLGAAASSDALRAGLSEDWNSLGFARYKDLLLSAMQRALGHGGLLCLLASGLFGWAASRAAPRALAALAGPLVLLIVAVDAAGTGRKFVHVADLGPFYAANPVADKVKQDGTPARLFYYFQPTGGRDPVVANLSTFHELDYFGVMPSPLPADDQRFFDAMGRWPLKLWQTASVRFLLGPESAFARLREHPAFKAVGHYRVENHRLVAAEPRDAPLVLLEYAAAQPRVTLYHAWRKATPEESLVVMSAPSWNPADLAVVSGDGVAESTGSGTSPARIVKRGYNSLVVECDAKADGLLVVTEKYDPALKARLDGAPVPVLRCNYLMRGVAVPAGRHTVEIVYQPYLRPFLVTLAATLALAVWAAARAMPCPFAGKSDRNAA
jgi:hypothetical protein